MRLNLMHPCGIRCCRRERCISHPSIEKVAGSACFVGGYGTFSISWQIWTLQFLHSAYTNFVMYDSRRRWKMEIDVQFHIEVCLMC